MFFSCKICLFSHIFRQINGCLFPMVMSGNYELHTVRMPVCVLLCLTVRAGHWACTADKERSCYIIGIYLILSKMVICMLCCWGCCWALREWKLDVYNSFPHNAIILILWCDTSTFTICQWWDGSSTVAALMLFVWTLQVCEPKQLSEQDTLALLTQPVSSGQVRRKLILGKLNGLNF